MAISLCVGWCVIDQVAKCVWIYVFRRHLNKMLVSYTSLFTYFIKLIVDIFEIGAWWWHWVRQFLFIIKPVPIISLQIWSQAMFRCWWWWYCWVKNNSWKQSKQRPWQHNALSLAGNEHTSSCVWMVNQTLFYTQEMTNPRLNLSPKIFVLIPNCSVSLNQLRSQFVYWKCVWINLPSF